MFPATLSDRTSAKEVLSFDDLAAWVTLLSVVLWQHIHTEYVRVPGHIGSQVIACASLQDLRAYREFVRVGRYCYKAFAISLPIRHMQLLPPRTRNNSIFELNNALQWIDPGHFLSFKTYGPQVFDTSDRCSYCDFYHAFGRLRELERKDMRRETRSRRSSLSKHILSRVGTPTRTPNQRTREVLVAC